MFTCWLFNHCTISRYMIDFLIDYNDFKRHILQCSIITFLISWYNRFNLNYTWLWWPFLQVFGRTQTPLNTIKKIGLLAVFSPLTNAGFILCNNMLRSKPLDYTVTQIREDVPSIVLTGYMIWFPTHFFLFTVIPLRHRVFFSNFVSVLWTCYLTNVSNART